MKKVSLDSLTLRSTAAFATLVAAACSGETAPVAPAPPTAQGSGALRAPASVPPDPPGALAVIDTRPAVIAQRATPPVSGGTLLVTADGTTAVIADSERDRITVVDIASGRVLLNLSLEAGDEPGRVVQSADGAVHVVLRGSGQLATFSFGSDILTRRSLCAEPRGVAFSPERDSLLVACRGGALLQVSAGSDAQTVASLPDDLRDVLVQPATATTPERVYVTRFRSAEVLELSADWSVVNTLRAPEREVGVVVESGEETGNIAAEPAGSAVLRLPYVAGVAWRAVTTPKGIVVTHQRARTDRVETVPGGYGSQGGCPIISTSVTRFQDDGTAAVLDGIAIAVAADVAVSADGKIAVVNTSRPDLEMLGLSFPGVNLYDDLEVSPPTLVPCESLESTTVLETGIESPTAVAFNPAVPSQLLIQLREPATLLVIDDVSLGDQSARRVSLEGVSVEDTGHDLFTRATFSGVACAGCHVEGEEDGRTWDFVDFGARRTQSMAAGIQAPFHWQGDLATFRDLFENVMVDRMGGMPQVGNRVDALANWLDRLRPPSPLQQTSELVAEGEALFFSAEVGCAQCHGQSMIDSVDVGTGQALQVPSLVGVGYRAPLMHDGCATTLHDRFLPECGGGDLHGRTSQLTPAQIDALVAYLKTL